MATEPNRQDQSVVPHDADNGSSDSPGAPSGAIPQTCEETAVRSALEFAIRGHVSDAGAWNNIEVIADFLPTTQHPSMD